MKKIILTVGAIACAAMTYGQGTVNFANNAATAVTNSLTGLRVITGTTFRVSLYYIEDQATAPTTADFDARGVVVSSTHFNTPSAGQFAGGAQATPAPLGAFGWFQVRGWETVLGTGPQQITLSTYAAAVANSNPANAGRLALAGTSNILRVKTGGDGAPPANPGSLVNNGLQSFFLVPVPEPSIIALGVLGIGALLLLRRRQ